MRIKNCYRLKVIVKKRIFYFNTKYSTNNFVHNILACISVLSVLDLDLNNMEKKFTKGKGSYKEIIGFKEVYINNLIKN